MNLLLLFVANVIAGCWLGSPPNMVIAAAVSFYGIVIKPSKRKQ